MMMCPGCGNPLYKGKDGAYLCEGGEYRYFLQLPTGREGNRTSLFLMLNPGTEKGHEQKSHRTRDKCHELAAKWGYGTLWTCNLFAAGGAKPAQALSIAALHGKSRFSRKVSQAHVKSDPHIDCYVNE